MVTVNQLHISAVPMLAFFGFPAAAEGLVLALVDFIITRAAVQVTLDQMVTALMHKKTRLANLNYQINGLGLAAILGQKMSAELPNRKRYKGHKAVAP